MRRLRMFAVFAFCLLSSFDAPAQTAALSLIQDEETERVLRGWLTPVFQAAGLDASEMAIHLVRDDSINAFAAKGLHVFIHTGLITKSDSAQEVIAVLAHETGHIAGGHIVRLYENIRIARRNMLISMLVASVAGVASGRGDVGLAAMTAGTASAQNLLMGYRRSEENAADQSAVTFLKKTGHGLDGFRDIMKKLQAQENLSVDPKAGDMLWRTHPEIKDRLAFILNQNDKMPKPDESRIRRENEEFKRIRAKLYAFLYPPEKTLKKFPQSDNSLPALYARAVATYRSGRFDNAVAQMDALIARYPDNPYFYELKGQILLETGQAEKAVNAYEKAVSLLPDSVSLRVGYAQALTETDKRSDLIKAVDTLEPVAAIPSFSPFVWRLLAIAYGRSGRLDMAAYAQAENAFAQEDFLQAETFARKAVDSLPENSAASIRASDILEQTKSVKNAKKRLAH